MLLTKLIKTMIAIGNNIFEIKKWNGMFFCFFLHEMPFYMFLNVYVNLIKKNWEELLYIWESSVCVCVRAGGHVKK